MHRASMIVAEILDELAAAVKPGITTEELDRLAEELTYSKGARAGRVGKISDCAERLLRVTRAALYAGIEQAQIGNRISDIARAVQQTAESAGFSVVTDFAGHGIGRSLHEDPQVPNYVRRGMPNPRLQEGMVLAIEPMINEGTADLEILEDGWTAVTA